MRKSVSDIMLEVVMPTREQPYPRTVDKIVLGIMLAGILLALSKTLFGCAGASSAVQVNRFGGAGHVQMVLGDSQLLDMEFMEVGLILDDGTVQNCEVMRILTQPLDKSQQGISIELKGTHPWAHDACKDAYGVIGEMGSPPTPDEGEPMLDGGADALETLMRVFETGWRIVDSLFGEAEQHPGDQGA